MSSTLHRGDFDSEEAWRAAVRDSANAEFRSKAPEGVCPLYSFLERKEMPCDCPVSLIAIGFQPCDQTVVVCPVRNVGWPEHTPGRIAVYSTMCQASREIP